MQTLNSCKAEIVFGFYKIQKHYKAGLAWPCKREVLDYRFSNLVFKDTESLYCVSVKDI